jgi:hypothetical protein
MFSIPGTVDFANCLMLDDFSVYIETSLLLSYALLAVFKVTGVVGRYGYGRSFDGF